MKFRIENQIGIYDSDTPLFENSFKFIRCYYRQNNRKILIYVLFTLWNLVKNYYLIKNIRNR
jgi:hypothetical protein